MILIQSWPDAANLAFMIREAVFIQEQGIPLALEVDDDDLQASHALAFAADQCVGTGRLIGIDSLRCQIGRMSVLKNYRQQGIGGQILQALMAHGIEQGFRDFLLHSQVTALPFYEKWGFIAEGEIYQEAGIPHRSMKLLS